MSTHQPEKVPSPSSETSPSQPEGAPSLAPGAPAKAQGASGDAQGAPRAAQGAGKPFHRPSKTSTKAFLIGAGLTGLTLMGVVLGTREKEDPLPEITSFSFADDAIDELERIHSDFHVGMQMLSFAEDLAVVLENVEAFEASIEPPTMPRVAELIREAKAHYEFVAATWLLKLGPREGRTAWQVPSPEEAARFFGATPEESLATVARLRRAAESRGDESRPDTMGYVDDLVAQVMTRGGDLARAAREQLEARLQPAE